MTIEAIRDQLHTRPFERFVLYVDDGTLAYVTHPDAISWVFDPDNPEVMPTEIHIVEPNPTRWRKVSLDHVSQIRSWSQSEMMTQ